MTPASCARSHDRLTELVVILSGVGVSAARGAITEATKRSDFRSGNGDDNLAVVADAIVALRNNR